MPKLNAAGFPEWNYEHYPSHDIREQRCVALLLDLAQGHLTLEVDGVETRPIHERMFTGMTEAGEEYFAGHYRGENYPFLSDYRVVIGMDPRVGTDPALVATEMQVLAQGVTKVATILETDAASNLTQGDKLIRSVAMACALLVEFLRVHPYANGNGHVGRFLVWLALAKVGAWPRTWPLNDKVPMPYPFLLTEYRDGNRQPLIQFVLSHI